MGALAENFTGKNGTTQNGEGRERERERERERNRRDTIEKRAISAAVFAEEEC
jgi:hypothetical protein